MRAVWPGSMLFAISFYTCNRVGKRTVWILIRLLSGWIHTGRKRTKLVLSWRSSKKHQQYRYKIFISPMICNPVSIALSKKNKIMQQTNVAKPLIYWWICQTWNLTIWDKEYLQEAHTIKKYWNQKHPWAVALLTILHRKKSRPTSWPFHWWTNLLWKRIPKESRLEYNRNKIIIAREPNFKSSCLKKRFRCSVLKRCCQDFCHFKAMQKVWNRISSFK
jgi:hypothetical protein